MSKKQLKALQESRSHWVRMREDRRKGRPVADQCACCQLVGPDDDGCYDCEKGCPICEFTGIAACYDTPFYRAANAYHDESRSEWQAAATAEIEFLDTVIEWVKQGKPERT